MTIHYTVTGNKVYKGNNKITELRILYKRLEASDNHI